MSKPKSWFRMKADGANGEIYIYDEIGFWGITAKDFIDALKALGEVETIDLFINSPGGDVFAGTAIYNALKRHDARVTVYVDGLAASAASLVAMAGDEVVMPENSMMMVHNPSGLVIGTAEDMEKMADTLGKIKSGLVAAYVARSGLSDEEVEEIMSAETWLTAADAVELGFADRVEGPVMAVANFDLSRFKNVPASMPAFTAAADGGPIVGNQGENDMPDKKSAPAAKLNQPEITAEYLLANFMDVVEELVGKASDKARDEGAAAERQRLTGIDAEAKGFPGHGDLVAKAKADPSMTVEKFALALLAAERDSGRKVLKDLKADDEEEAPAAAIDNGGGDSVSASAPVEDRCQAKWDKDADLRAEFQGDFGRYLAFEKAVEAGQVKILTRRAS